MQRQRAEAVADAIVSRLAHGAVRAIFAGGSLGRGEVWAARVGERIEVYSDVDLYVVVTDASLREEVRCAARGSGPAAVGSPLATFLRGVEVGVYTESDLLAQPVRPGTADLGEHHLLLYGDSSVPGRLATAMARPVDPFEALYLLENRVRELSLRAAADDASMRRLGAVMALKGRLDVGTAYLVAVGRFSSSPLERERELGEAAPEFMPEGARAGVMGAFAASRRLDEYLHGVDARAELASTLCLAAESWRRIAAHLDGGSADEPWVQASWRCLAGHRLTNAREVIRLRHAARWSVMSAARACARLARFSPQRALRMYALVGLWQRQEPAWQSALEPHVHYVDDLTRALGIEDGALEERSWAAYRVITGES